MKKRRKKNTRDREEKQRIKVKLQWGGGGGGRKCSKKINVKNLIKEEKTICLK